MNSKNDEINMRNVALDDILAIALAVAGDVTLFWICIFLFIEGLYFLGSGIFFVHFIFLLIFIWSAVITYHLTGNKTRPIKKLVYANAIIISILCIILALLRLQMGML